MLLATSHSYSSDNRGGRIAPNFRDLVLRVGILEYVADHFRSRKEFGVGIQGVLAGFNDFSIAVRP